MQALQKIGTEAKVIEAKIKSGVIDLKAITQLLEKVGAVTPTAPRPARERINYYKSQILKK